MNPSGACAAFLLRVFQSALWSMPYLLAGLLIAAAFRAMLGPATIRRLMGEGRWLGPPRAWLVGLLIPVSALGALPILAELRRARVRPGSLAALGVSVAAFHPLSLAYGASSLGLQKLAVFLLGSLALASIVGWAVNACCTAAESPTDPPGPVPGLDRLKAMGVSMARTLVGPLAVDLAVGLTGAGLLGALLSPEFLPPHLSARDPLAPAAMALVALPALVLPEKAVMGAVEMSKLGMAPGAMFVLITVGAGVGLGTLSWAFREWGWRRAGALFGLGLATTLAIGYGVNLVIAPTGLEDLDTHAFDDLANPFWGYGFIPSAFEGRLRKVIEGAVPGWPVASALLGATAAAGAWLRLRRPGLTFESFAAPPAEASPRPAARPLPRWLVTGLGAGMAGAGAVVALLAYFPAPEHLFPDLQVTYADVYSSVQSDPPEATLGHIEHLSRLASKVAPGSVLRGGRPADASAKDKALAFNRQIDQLRQAVSGGHREEAKRLVVELGRAYRACRAAYLGGPAEIGGPT